MSMRVGELIQQLEELAAKKGSDQIVFVDIGGGENCIVLSVAHHDEEREDMNEEGDGLGDIIASEGVYIQLNVK